MNRWKTLAAIASVLPLGVGVHPAAGGPITFEFAGEITFVSDVNNFLGGTITAGNPFFGSFTFESTTPDSSPEDPTLGAYVDVFTDISGHFGGLSFLGPVGATNSISVVNGFIDGYAVSADIDVLGETLKLVVNFIDGDGMAFSDDSLPLSPPDLTSFDTALFSIFDASELIPLTLQGEIISLTPEPGTLALLAIGVLLVAKRRSGTRARLG